MKPQLIKLADNFGSSFHVRFDRSPNINSFLHYHLESELVYVKRGRGSWIIGDEEQRFAEGDVLLIGPGLPHWCKFDPAFLNGNAGGVEVFVIHFSENFWGTEFLFLPENAILRTLFEKSKSGVFLQDSTNRYIGYLMHRIVHVKGAARILLLMDVLLYIGDLYTDENLICAAGSGNGLPGVGNKPIHGICEYIMANFQRKIEIEELARIANISPNSFCRYFKTETGHTYMRFLIETRLKYACQLLRKGELSVKQVSYESGFSSLAGFHRHFKEMTGQSPLNYRSANLSPIKGFS
ncbi:AraC family transcriptional regulator [Pedobacter sp. KBW06]|uniref:helix-turn-helix domain-containing protein n=1 Tax=Pedobacter sp. KBW06 TaxID=2153359 RepID=UPI000F5B25EE|nr:AraC family transcriptional regulator [Pedobacter sp. KBW06]RQO74611.1 AraC family transcriptional regulator [Pedobacter sp. KBW06]